jgi:hypothetical protein
MGKSKQPRKRNIRATKWLGVTPAIAVCTACDREFKTPMSALRRTGDAQANLQAQFDVHECENAPKPTEGQGKTDREE